MRQEGYTADKLEQLLNKASGLKVSQSIRDMQITAVLAEGNWLLTSSCIACVLPLVPCSFGGIRYLVFTAGIGENYATIRAAACDL